MDGASLAAVTAIGIDIGEVSTLDDAAAAEADGAARAEALAGAAVSGGVLANSRVAALATGANVVFRAVGLVELPGSGGAGVGV